MRVRPRLREPLGVYENHLCALIGLRACPVKKTGGLTALAQKICDMLGLSPCDLWDDDQIGMTLERNTWNVEVTGEQAKHYLEQAKRYLPGRTLTMEESLEVRDLVHKALALCNPRQAAVLRARYFQEKTREQVAKDLGVSLATVQRERGNMSH